MEPEISKPNINQEVTHANYEKNVELDGRLNKVESGIESGAEAFEQASELAAKAADSASTGQSFVLPAPVQPSADDSSLASKNLNDTPVAASDDDLIEKEWVDKAKKIINETKTDPYRREEAVSELQRDYQRKRYGRELGDA